MCAILRALCASDHERSRSRVAQIDIRSKQQAGKQQRRQTGSRVRIRMRASYSASQVWHAKRKFPRELPFGYARALPVTLQPIETGNIVILRLYIRIRYLFQELLADVNGDCMTNFTLQRGFNMIKCWLNRYAKLPGARISNDPVPEVTGAPSTSRAAGEVM